MELPREHARQAIRLVKRQQTELKLTSMTSSEVIDMCTETALSLQGGAKPMWYDESISHSSRKSSRKRDQPSSNSCPPLTTGGATLTDIDENKEAIKQDLTDDGMTAPTSTNDTSSVETSLEYRSTSSQSSRSSSDRLTNKASSLTESSLTFERSRSVTPLLSERRIPSSGLITTLTPSPVLGLQPIRITVRRPFTGIESREMLKKQMLTRIEVNLEKASNRKKEVKQEEKRKKKAISKPVRKQGNEMDKLEVVTEYWNIPFDPLREGVISDHKICNIPELEDEEEAAMNKKDVLLDIDYWEIQKILRFVRIGNPTATVLALCVLKEMDLNKPSCKEIIHHLNGISLFLNILDTKNYRCRVAALKVLVLMASSKTTSDIILRKNGIQRFVSILEENDKVAMSITCDVLSLLARHNSVRVVANRLDIIRKLMTVFQTCVKATLKGENLTLCQHVCRALWRFSKSIREQDVAYVSESLAVISHLVDTQKEALVVPLLGVVEECASVESFRCQMEKENFLEKVMWKVESKERTVQVLCVKIMFKCVGDRKFQRMLLKSNSLQHLMNLLKENVHESNDELLMLLLGIVWRCSVNQKHRKKFENFHMFPLLVEILKSNKNLQIKSAALGVLSEFLWDEFYTEYVVNYGAVNLLMEFMTSTEPSILVNSARCLGVCARNRSWRGIILQLDGLRLLWSLLKSYSDEVLASGAVAVASVCTCPKESANAVRSIVGGVELLMSLITSTDLTKHKVLICLCQAATNIAQDAENLSILTDYGLIPALLRLYETKDKILRYYVTCLIERCCEAKTERNILSKCIPFLVEGLGNDYDDHVHCASICALNQLSRDLTNCVFLREPHTTKTLLNMLGSSNERIQDAAAGCLANVRKSMTVT